MPKAYVSIKQVEIEDGQPRIVYTVAVAGTNLPLFGQDFFPDSSLSMQTNLDVLKGKIANHIVGSGYKMSTGDVLIFGAPVVKDPLSLNDSSKGITSDSTATVMEPVQDKELGMVARIWNWMVG
jgi:hypothetical protein